jgi:hypothetical protein
MCRCPARGAQTVLCRRRPRWATSWNRHRRATPPGDDYWRDAGLPEEDLGIGENRIVDPAGRGPRIWFQIVPERKTIKNRIHPLVHIPPPGSD